MIQFLLNDAESHWNNDKLLMSTADEWICSKMIDLDVLSFRCSFSSLVSLIQRPSDIFVFSKNQSKDTLTCLSLPRCWTFSMKGMRVWNERPRYLRDFVRATEEECHILPSYYPSETLIYNTSAAIEYRKILKHLIYR